MGCYIRMTVHKQLKNPAEKRQEFLLEKIRERKTKEPEKVVAELETYFKNNKHFLDP